MFPWSSKHTAQISSPSSVDTVIFSLTHTGYTMGHWREVNSLALPSLVQCTQSRVIQSTEWQPMEWAMCKLSTDTSFNVCTAYWATSSRAMLSSTPSPLLVSACNADMGQCVVANWYSLWIVCIYIQTHTHARTHTQHRHTHTQLLGKTLLVLCMISMRIHTDTHTHAHTHTCTHMHTCIQQHTDTHTHTAVGQDTTMHCGFSVHTHFNVCMCCIVLSANFLLYAVNGHGCAYVIWANSLLHSV